MLIQRPQKYLSEFELYVYIRFFKLVLENESDPDNDDEYARVSLENLGIDKHQNYNVFNAIHHIEDDITLVAEVISDKERDEEIEKAKERIKQKPLEKREKLYDILKKIETSGKITLEEVGVISWVMYDIYSYIRLTPEEYTIPKNVLSQYKAELDEYLANFINNKLTISRQNFYKFEIQKKNFIQIIEEKKNISLYGNNFIISEEIDASCVTQKKPAFCLLHTAYALQKMGYITIVDIWTTGSDYSTRHINLNIIVHDSLVREINDKYKKENPKNIFEKFDEKRGLLNFAGQEIELSKKGKETDAVLLMKTLLKVEDDSWMHNDEILENWGYSDEDQKDIPKNKVYFAGQKINNAIALKTQIEDFVECNTSKARINPKYRKIDE